MSNVSRDYYSSSRPSSSRQLNPYQSLPPLRSVLGDELDLPVRSGPAHDTRDMGKARDPLTHAHGIPAGQGYQQRENTRAPGFPPYAAQSESTHRGDYRQSSCGYGGHNYGGGYDATQSSSRTGADNRRYVCQWPGCDKRFERQNALDTHMNIHTDTKPFACPVPHCGKTFNVRSNMRRHLLTHKEGLADGMHDVDEYNDPRQSSSSNYYSSSRRS